MGLLDQYAGKKLERFEKPRGLLNVIYDEATNPDSVTSRNARKALLIDKDTFNRAMKGDKDATGQILSQGMNMAGMAPLGMTVWHGSPHKFSKFDMSKIGTGEGAQAYGHGLYVAESPGVAKSYKDTLAKPELTVSGKRMKWDDMDVGVAGVANDLNQFGGDVKALKEHYKSFPKLKIAQDRLKQLSALGDDLSVEKGALYKVDIPDEAVARFLDWDKPLSQQAPEVQKVFGGVDPNGRINTGLAYERWRNSEGVDPVIAAEKLKELGIPGIRYLDGGSRSAGQGSSNFVLFDDQLPRILEINGQATGNQAWNPGEWKGLLTP